jgi:hypothetical protein
MVVFSRADDDGANIYSLDLGSRRVTKLTSGLLVRDWRVSPDASRVAVRYRRLESPRRLPGPPEIERPLAVVSVASPLAVKSVDRGVGYGDFGLAWRSNDALLFGLVVEKAGSRYFEVAEYHVSSDTRRVLLKGRGLVWYTGRPLWSSDGHYVVYPSAVRSKDGSLRENWRTLRRLNTTTGQVDEIPFPAELRARLSLSRDGGFVAAIASETGELWLGSFASRKTKKAVLDGGHTRPARPRPRR